MPKGLKKVFDVFSTIIVVLVVVLTILLVGVRLFGLQVFSVLSGSMEPDYHVGSLIYVKEVDPHELETGDVITYMISEDTVVTHQIAGVVLDEQDPTVWRFRTKGIANAQEDATLVHEKNVVGSPVFTIPYLGYLANYIQNPPGTYYAIAFAAFLLMLMFLPDLFSDDKSKKKERKRSKAKKEGRALPEREPEPAMPVEPVEEAVAEPATVATVTAEPEKPAPEADRDHRLDPDSEEFDFDLFLADIQAEFDD